MAEAKEIIDTEPDAATADADVGTTESPPASGPRMLGEIIISQLAALRAYHLGVIQTGSVDAVHKMRVTTRRLQASLDLLEREMKIKKYKRQLRSWRRKLSTVRNYDVFLELIEKEAATKRKARRAQLELIKAILQDRRVRRAVKVTKFLESINVDAIGVGLGLIATSNVSLSSEDSPGTTSINETRVDVIDVTNFVDERKVAAYAAERLEQRLTEFQALAASSHPTNDPTELHQLRIAAKRVRYLLETVTQMGFGDATRALAWLRTLQDRIGDWHDLEALEEEIVLIVSSREFMKQHFAESSQMLQAASHLQTKKEKLVSKLFPVRVPRLLELTCLRVGRALRRYSLARSKAVSRTSIKKTRKPTSKNPAPFPDSM
jgi:CHAD domain-containing protein